MKAKLVFLTAILTLLAGLCLAACQPSGGSATETTPGTEGATSGGETAPVPPVETEDVPEEETFPEPQPIDRSEYPKEQAGAKTETVLDPAAFGVVGDGRTDDGPAIGRAIEAAMEQKATLRFASGKTYYIGSTDRNANVFASPFAMNGAEGVTVDGGGSVFRFAPGSSTLPWSPARISASAT